MAMIKDIHQRVLTACMFEYGKLPNDPDNPLVEILEDDWLFIIERVEQEIKNYCAIRSVPQALVHTWASICVDYAKWWIASTMQDQEADDEDEDILADGSVEQVKVGDVNVQLGDKRVTRDPNSLSRGLAMGAHVPSLDLFLMDYTSTLQQFRTASWGPSWRR